MPDQPALYALQTRPCSDCAGRGHRHHVPAQSGYAPVCPTCHATGEVETRLPLAEALQSDPETRAALRAVLAEVCREMAASGLAPGVWLAAAARVLEKEQD